MSIKSNIPQIVALRQRVEERFGKQLSIHADFVELVSAIETDLRQHISESTLERVWGYSTRGYDNVSLRTLDVLSQYAVGCDWQSYCLCLEQESGCESELFNAPIILSESLQEGDRLRIGWLPNRMCTVRYIGGNKFVAEECLNSKLQPGDTFSCAQFVLGKQLTMTNYMSKLTPLATPQTYIVGTHHGLTTLSLIISISDE